MPIANSCSGIQFPYILLTNGGGKTEEARCAQLSEVLGVPISTDQFIQSHTPMQALAEYYENVLVCGGEGFKVREVAESYGFKNVIHPKDILAWDPTISPCRKFTEEEQKLAKPRDFSKFKFDAIMCFAESHDQSTEFQIILDLLLSANGKLLTRAKDPAARDAVAGHIPIYFSQGDLLCPTEHKGPHVCTWVLSAFPWRLSTRLLPAVTSTVSSTVSLSALPTSLRTRSSSPGWRRFMTRSVCQRMST